MALAWTINSRFKEGKYTRLIGAIAWDSSYPTDGESFSDGLGDKVLDLNVHPYKGYTFEPDYTNKKIKAYVPISVDGGAAAAGTDALSIKANVIDKEAATVMHSAGKEVPDTTDLSGLTAGPFTCLQM